jgi:hypothetical protein
MAPAVNVMAARQAVRAELAQGAGPGGAGPGGVGITLRNEPPFEARAAAAAPRRPPSRTNWTCLVPPPY